MDIQKILDDLYFDAQCIVMSCYECRNTPEFKRYGTCPHNNDIKANFRDRRAEFAFIKLLRDRYQYLYMTGNLDEELKVTDDEIVGMLLDGLPR